MQEYVVNNARACGSALRGGQRSGKREFFPAKRGVMEVRKAGKSELIRQVWL